MRRRRVGSRGSFLNAVRVADPRSDASRYIYSPQYDFQGQGHDTIVIRTRGGHTLYIVRSQVVANRHSLSLVSVVVQTLEVQTVNTVDTIQTHQVRLIVTTRVVVVQCENRAVLAGQSTCLTFAIQRLLCIVIQVTTENHFCRRRPGKWSLKYIPILLPKIQTRN